MIVKILESQSIYLPQTLIYSNVELRSYEADTQEENTFFESIAKRHNLNYEHYKLCARISTIVEDDSIENATTTAENRFLEILDLKSTEVPTSNLTLSSIGLAKNLDDGRIHEISNNSYRSSMSFFVHQGTIQKTDTNHYLLSLNTELSERYLRSLHWVRNAKHENNKQLKILFYWFAVEALLKESESDNITNIIRWCLGFPNGKQSLNIPKDLIKKLQNHDRYEHWKKNLPLILDRIRIFRNESVHHGFRSVDFSNRELNLYCEIMTYSSSRCLAAVKTALVNKIAHACEFKEYIHLIFESNENIVNDVHNNILFSLNRLSDDYF